MENFQEPSTFLQEGPRGNAEGAVFECELPSAEFATVCVRTGAAQPGEDAEHRHALAIRKAAGSA